MSKIYYGSHHGYYSPEPPSSGYEGIPTEIVGFRLVHDDIDEHRFRWGRSFTVPAEEAIRSISLEDFPYFRNQRISFRLAKEGQ